MATSGRCKRELEDMGTFDIVLGTVLFIVSSLSIIPSLRKPVRLQSTVGLSPTTLLLTNLQQTLTVANVIVLKFPHNSCPEVYGERLCRRCGIRAPATVLVGRASDQVKIF